MRTKGWFGPKQFGWGVTPRSWEGWAIILAYIGFLFVALKLGVSTGTRWTMAGVATAIVAVVMFLTYAGDPPDDL